MLAAHITNADNFSLSFVSIVKVRIRLKTTNVAVRLSAIADRQNVNNQIIINNFFNEIVGGSSFSATFSKKLVFSNNTIKVIALIKKKNKFAISMIV